MQLGPEISEAVMEFDGLMPFRLGFPTISVGEMAQQFDLHNDGELREFNIDFRDHFVRLVWLLKQPAWEIPARPEPWQRKTIAGLTLIFSGVCLVTLSGIILDSASGSNALDFLEYSPSARNLGEARIVMESSAEARIVASKCQMRTMEKP